MMPYAYFGSGISVLVSTHRDGELIARTVKRFPHIDCVRGSSTRGWISGVKGALIFRAHGQRPRDNARRPQGAGPRGADWGSAHGREIGLSDNPGVFRRFEKRLRVGTPSSSLPVLKGRFRGGRACGGNGRFLKRGARSKEARIGRKLNDCTERADRFFERTPRGEIA